MTAKNTWAGPVLRIKHLETENNKLLAALKQIERLAREADKYLVALPEALGDIARKAIIEHQS